MATFNRSETKTLILTCYGHFLAHFNMFVFPALVLPLSRQLDRPISEVLELSFWMYLLFGLTALGWGVLGDRWKPVALLRIMFLGAGLSAIFAAMHVSDGGDFVLALAAIGFFSGIYHPIGLGILSQRIRASSVAMGYNGMSGNFGLAVAPLLAGWLQQALGISATYFIVGGLNLSGLLLFFRLPEPVPSTLNQTANDSPTRANLRPFVILLIAMMLAGVAYRGASVIVPAFLALKSDSVISWLTVHWPGTLTPNVVATTVTSLIFLVGMLGQYAGGHLAQRANTRRMYVMFNAAIIPAAAAIYFLSDFALIVVVFFYFFFMLGSQPIENTLISRFTPPHLRFSAYGTKFVLTFGVGSLAVKLVSWIQTHWSIEAVFPALGVVAVLLVATGSLLLFEKR